MSHIYHLNVCYISGIYSVQYIIMWCLALMENQWGDKPATAETILKQFLNWHMEGLCDWFWLLLDFNPIHCELIDCQTPSCGLSTNCQVSPCLLFLLSHPFSPVIVFFFSLVAICLSSCLGEFISWITPDIIIDKRAEEVPPMHPCCNRSCRTQFTFFHISSLQNNTLVQTHIQSPEMVRI